jgi:galactose mutarotase-like enzyme
MKEVVELSKNGIMATISLKGAELISLKKADKSSILWEKDDVFWNRTAPNLFPIVGRLFNDSYSFEGETYHMSQHGFVRDQNFSVSNQSSESVDLNLMWNEESLERYPFKYDLTIRYTLTENGVNVQYVVKNVDDKKIGFSIGGHPGFQLKDELDMYKLVFSNPFLLERHELEGAYYSGKRSTIDCNGELDLNNALFENDAVVFKKPSFSWVALVHKAEGELVRIHFDQIDAIGFWTKKDAPFFCIEPWWGWADELNHTGDFQSKAGLHWLDIGQTQDFKYSIVLP